MRKFAADSILAISAYFAGLLLRFGGSVGPFVPYARRAWPIVVGAQLLALVLVRAYHTGLSSASLVRRFVAGVLLGASAGATAALWWMGREGLSFAALAAGVILFLLGGTLYRCVEAVRRLRRRVPSSAEPPPGMQTIGGPRTLSLSLRDALRYRPLVRGLVTRDLKLKYRGSALGFLWSLLNPLVMVAVYTIAFTYFLRVQQEGFVLQLLVGLLAWTFFANSALMSTGAVVDSGGLIKSVYFPRSILPIATVFFNLSQYVLTLIVFLPVMFVFYRVPPAAPMLVFPIFLALQVCFTLGVAFAVSAMTATYRDVKHLTEIGLSVLFWLTPIVYTVARMADPVRHAVLLSPMSAFVVAYQQIFYARAWPDAYLWTMAIVYAVTTLVGGAALFFTLEDRFAEQV